MKARDVIYLLAFALTVLGLIWNFSAKAESMRKDIENAHEKIRKLEANYEHIQQKLDIIIEKVVELKVEQKNIKEELNKLNNNFERR